MYEDSVSLDGEREFDSHSIGLITRTRLGRVRVDNGTAFEFDSNSLVVGDVCYIPI